MSALLPDPSLTRVYRLEATVGEPLDLGDIAQGRRRIVPLTGGTFAGPELNGTLLPGSSADWQIVLPDGTALGDIRYTLQTDDGDLLYVQSRGVRHGSAECSTVSRAASSVRARVWRRESAHQLLDDSRQRLPPRDQRLLRQAWPRNARRRARLGNSLRLIRRRQPHGQRRHQDA